MNLLMVGAEPAADGHGVVPSPYRLGRCSFTACDPRTWTTLDEIDAGMCGAETAYRVDVAADFADGTTGTIGRELCGPCARHVETCPECGRWAERIHAVGG